MMSFFEHLGMHDHHFDYKLKKTKNKTLQNPTKTSAQVTI
jgi:hypothetical protein